MTGKAGYLVESTTAIRIWGVWLAVGEWCVVCTYVLVCCVDTAGVWWWGEGGGEVDGQGSWKVGSDLAIY